jgi:hypothetical protein
MEPQQSKQERTLEMRGVVTVVAVVLVLMGFSAALATKEEPAAAPVEAPSAAPAHQDPSLAGLRVAEDAAVDTTELYY